MNSALVVTLSEGKKRTLNCFRKKQINAESLGMTFDLLHLHRKKHPCKELIFPDTERPYLAEPTQLKRRLKPLSKMS
jgi:hypothetical protein